MLKQDSMCTGLDVKFQNKSFSKGDCVVWSMASSTIKTPRTHLSRAAVCWQRWRASIQPGIGKSQCPTVGGGDAHEGLRDQLRAGVAAQHYDHHGGAKIRAPSNNLASPSEPVTFGGAPFERSSNLKWSMSTSSL